MSRKTIAIVTGLALAILASALWAMNGWGVALGVMYIAASVLITGAVVVWFAERGD